jgi:hypothetical protein
MGCVDKKMGFGGCPMLKKKKVKISGLKKSIFLKFGMLNCRSRGALHNEKKIF